MIIYMLSTHDEYGAEDVKMTMDKNKVMQLIDSYGRNDAPEVKKKAAVLIETEGPSGNGHDLSEFVWGGLQLHIVECV